MKTLVSKHYLAAAKVSSRRCDIADRSALRALAQLTLPNTVAPTVSMNSSTMSSTTERADRTRSSEPTTCPTK